MLKAYKTELDPNNRHRTQLVRYCGVARFVFNWALADRKSRYEQELTTSMYEQKRRFNALKDEQFPWVRDVAYTVLQAAFDNSDIAYKNFFRRVKSGTEKAGFPKFKSKKRGLGNFTLRGNIHAQGSTIQLPRLGVVRLKEDNYLPTSGVKILSATINERARHWFVSLQVEEPDKPVLQPSSGIIGVDVGIKTLATCSDGTTFENPKSLSRYEKRLAHIQRELSRRQKGSKNRAKTKQKVAKLHYRIANIRRYSLHQVSSYLAVKAKPETIVLEDLNVAGMLQNRHLSKAVVDASFAELRRQLEYKCSWYGVGLVVADRFFPSSKTCASCGTKKPLLKLSERTFVCESCGVVIDRDFNASLNLARLGSSSLNFEPPNKRGLPVEGTSGLTYTGIGPVKQEPGSCINVNPGLPSLGISTSGVKRG